MPEAALLGLPLVWLEVQAHVRGLEEGGPLRKRGSRAHMCTALAPKGLLRVGDSPLTSGWGGPCPSGGSDHIPSTSHPEVHSGGSQSTCSCQGLPAVAS